MMPKAKLLSRLFAAEHAASFLAGYLGLDASPTAQREAQALLDTLAEMRELLEKDDRERLTV